MLDQAIDRVDEKLSTHAKLVSAISIGWLALTSAVYAKFITLPDIPFLTDEIALWTSVVFNGVWWGFLYPRVEERRKARASSEDNE